jgi:hypothetical protein
MLYISEDFEFSPTVVSIVRAGGSPYRTGAGIQFRIATLSALFDLFTKHEPPTDTPVPSKEKRRNALNLLLDDFDLEVTSTNQTAHNIATAVG